MLQHKKADNDIGHPVDTEFHPREPNPYHHEHPTTTPAIRAARDTVRIPRQSQGVKAIVVLAACPNGNDPP